MTEASLIDIVAEWTCSHEQAEYWFYHIPIPAYGHKTAKQVFDLYGFHAVEHYVEQLKHGGYA